MLDHQHRPFRLSRLFLLLAGLLYFAGAAAEPLLHVYAESESGATAVLADDASQDTDEPGPAVPHGDGDPECLLCKVAAPITLSAGGPVVAHHLAEVRSVFELSSCSRAPPATLSSQPRAPPLA